MAKQADRTTATVAAIVAAARAQFGASGFAATSIDEIAQLAGVAKGAVYHHFRSKQDVFDAVCRAVSADLAAEIAVGARGEPDALAALAEGTRLYFEAATRGPTGRIVLGDGPKVLGWNRWREIDHEYFGGMVPAALERAISAGVIPAQPVEPLATLLLGAITEAAMASASSAEPTESGATLSKAFTRLLDGLRR